MLLRRVASSLAGRSWPAEAAALCGKASCSAGSRHSSSAAAGTSDAEEQGEQQQRKAALGRLLYRSKQRGFLEMDLLVGLWAQANLPGMDAQRLAAFEAVLDQENPDLFKWITGQEEPPAEMAANPAFTDLRRHVAAQLEQHRANEAMTRPGKEWVRGWDDWNKAPPQT